MTRPSLVQLPGNPVDDLARKIPDYAIAQEEVEFIIHDIRGSFDIRLDFRYSMPNSIATIPEDFRSSVR